MAHDETEELAETRPGEKGPPAWKARHTGDEPMPDEPPDSSSEVDQVSGLFYDEDDEDDGSES